MRKGFTTGSCAAAASKAAAMMLLGGTEKNKIEITTPAGIVYSPDIENITKGDSYVKCAVRKDSGDDPDITNGSLVYAKVSYTVDNTVCDEKVIIDGGEGVGKVTRPGLDQPVGNAAINSVPRRMIKAEVSQVMDLYDYGGRLIVEISVPEGEELASKTFNPKLGIEGGISIIGTTGIVEPMSTRALLETIRVSLRQALVMGQEIAVITPGNYGLDFMKGRYGYDLERAVKCSNYIGETIDMAAELGFKKLLLCGHVGKLIKVSGGIMNTHSKEADCRMELMAAAAIRCGAKSGTLEGILNCVSTEAAVDIFIREGIKDRCFDYIMERMDFFLQKRGAGNIDVQCMVYSNTHGLLGASKRAEEFIRESIGK
jgi:cobalt-precorrin-5B (C1)-methyltransferase